MTVNHKTMAIYLAFVLGLLLLILLTSCAVVTINTGEDVSLDTDDKKKPGYKKVPGLIKKLVN